MKTFKYDQGVEHRFRIFRDPLAGLHLTDGDFAWATRKLGEAAAELCGARLISVLEGGYDFRALAGSCVAHVKELMAV